MSFSQASCEFNQSKLSDELFHLCLLTNAVSQVVQLSTSYFTLSDYFDLLYIGRMYRPGLLNADTVGGFSYSEGLTIASTLSLQNNTLENLDSLAVTLFDLTVYTY